MPEEKLAGWPRRNVSPKQKPASETSTNRRVHHLFIFLPTTARSAEEEGGRRKALLRSRAEGHASFRADWIVTTDFAADGSKSCDRKPEKSQKDLINLQKLSLRSTDRVNSSGL